MIEVIKLIKELRQYPENSFAYPSEESDENYAGLVIVDLDGDQLGFISTGGEGKVIVK